MSQKKCPSCGAWNDGSAEKCSSCGELMDRKKAFIIKQKKEGKFVKKIEPGPMFEIKDSYPWWKKGVLYIVRPIFWTFFSIISGIMYLIAWLAA